MHRAYGQERGSEPDSEGGKWWEEISDEDEQRATRVPQSGPPIGTFPPLRTIKSQRVSGELQSAERGTSDEPHSTGQVEPDRFYHWHPARANSARRAYEADRDAWYKGDDP